MAIDIYSILQTRPHNPHYLIKYIRFIKNCETSNRYLSKSVYIENHHIAPKASDLFPEYSTVENNFVKLTARQHIIAHVMLWKAYGGSQTFALDCILNKFNSKTNSCLYNRKIPESILIRYHASLRESLTLTKSKIRKGKGIFKDSKGNKFLLKTDDPLIENLGLVGNNMGHQHSEEAKLKMSKAREVTKLYFIDMTTSLWKKEPDYPEKLHNLLSQGWTTYRLQEDIDWIKARTNQAISNRTKNKSRYALPSGEFYAVLDKDDPQVKELNLIPYQTDAHRDQQRRRIELATAAKLGSKTYNNGVVEIKRKDHPGDGWILGRLPRSQAHLEAQRLGLKKAREGKVCWNDGSKNYYLHHTENPLSGWVRGMAPQKPRRNRLI